MKRLAGLLVLMLAACATVSPPAFSGVFSNIQMHAETGDLGGVEMEVRPDGANAVVVFTRCEGGCYGGKTWPAAVDGDTITFSVVDDWFDEHGKLSEQTTTRYVGRLSGGVLSLTSPDAAEFGARLRRVPNPVPGHTEELATFG